MIVANKRRIAIGVQDYNLDARCAMNPYYTPNLECPGFFAPVTKRDWNKEIKWHEESDISLSRW